MTLVLAMLLVVGVVAMGYWIGHGGFFGFWMAWNLAEGISPIFAALIAAIASYFHQD